MYQCKLRSRVEKGMSNGHFPYPLSRSVLFTTRGLDYIIEYLQGNRQNSLRRCWCLPGVSESLARED